MRSDGELVKAYLAGDAPAFKELYEQCRKPLYTYLLKMLSGNMPACDDIYQEAWIRAIKNMDRFSDGSSFFPWISAIARNLVIDHFRRNGRISFVGGTEEFEDVMDPGEATWETIERSEMAGLLDEALDALPEVQREVVLLRLEDVDFKEIAVSQHCSLSTALSRMRYALTNMRRHFQSRRI